MQSVKLDGREEPLSGVAVLVVVQGLLALRAPSGERMTLREGDLLSLGLHARCPVDGERSRGEAIVFSAGVQWIDLAIGLGGGGHVPSPALAAVDMAGTDTAREAERVLRSLLQPPADRSIGARLRESAGWLRLASLALERRPETLAPCPVRRSGQRVRNRVHDLVLALASAPLADVKLGDLAANLQLSERQASRLIRQELGSSFRDLLSDLRLERAKTLLAESELPVIDVAAEAGWGSLSQFNTVFRRRVGMAPSAFRSAIRYKDHDEPRKPLDQ